MHVKGERKNGVHLAGGFAYLGMCEIERGEEEKGCSKFGRKRTPIAIENLQGSNK